jgi:hypothetical protein
MKWKRWIAESIFFITTGGLCAVVGFDFWPTTIIVILWIEALIHLLKTLLRVKVYLPQPEPSA